MVASMGQSIDSSTVLSRVTFDLSVRLKRGYTLDKDLFEAISYLALLLIGYMIRGK